MGDYQQYHYEMFDLDPEHPLKIISQPLYNHAAEHGFPPDFFTNSYFDHVDFGHIPEGVDCSGSQFRSCTFRGPIMKCVFDDAAIYDSNFERAVLRMVNFTRASIAHTRFRHSGLSFVSFLDARLKGGYMRDCSFDIVDFKGATIDGTWFRCTEARRVLNLYHASVTQGGATQEEADKFRISVFRALRVYPPPGQAAPTCAPAQKRVHTRKVGSMNKKQKESGIMMWVLLAIPAAWMGAVMAYVYEDGMNVFHLLGRFAAAMEYPFAIGWTAYTPRFVLGALVLYGFAVALYLSSRENRRPGEEHGSAKWGSPRQLCAKYRDKDPMKNTLLTQNVRMGLNGKIHRRNLLQIVIGGSGAGKTRFFCKPNLMQANCSFLVTDPKGETMRAVAPLLLEEGYEIKVFDLIDPTHSDSFNPFPYIKDDKDAMKLVNNLIKNTTPKNASNNDPFWEKSEIALDTALILYLLHEAPPEEQNFEMVMYMIENGGAREDDDDFQSPLDLLFEALEEEDPDHVAVREYKIFQQAAGKTAKSILLSAAVRLSAFILPQIVGITCRDDMELGLMGERKQAVFAIIPDNDGTFNYLVGMLYTCAFQALYYQADKVHQGALPVPVRLMMDEFCNVSLPDDFGKLQATMRSRNIMSTIVLQNISALKALFKDVWEGLMGNADTLLYLGGNEISTHKYISELLGKETIVTQNRSQSKGRNGSFSVSTQQAARELLTPDEVRTLDNDYALLFIRGEKPVMDKKYDILKHPNIKRTEDGGATPYVHHPGLSYALADLSVPFHGLDDIEIIE